MSWLDRLALAVLTSILHAQIQINFCTKHGLLKTNLYTCLYVPAASLSLSAATSLATKEIAKDIAQTHVAKVKVDVLPLATKPTKPFKRVAATGCAAYAS